MAAVLAFVAVSFFAGRAMTREMEKPASPYSFSSASIRNQWQAAMSEHTAHNLRGEPIGTNNKVLHLDNPHPLLMREVLGILNHMDTVDAGKYKGHYRITDIGRTEKEIKTLETLRETDKFRQPYPVAPPGPHNAHMHNYAVDVSYEGPESRDFYARLHTEIDRRGLVRFSYDKVHFQLSPAMLAAPCERLVTFKQVVDALMDAEGAAYVPSDGRGGASKFGVHGPDHGLTDRQVFDLTREKAEVYYPSYWKAIDGDQLSPEMRFPAFTIAAMHGTENAKEMIRKADGDTEKLIALSAARCDHLADIHYDLAKYREEWKERHASLGYYVEAFRIDAADTTSNPSTALLQEFGGAIRLVLPRKLGIAIIPIRSQHSSPMRLSAATI